MIMEETPGLTPGHRRGLTTQTLVTDQSRTDQSVLVPSRRIIFWPKQQ